MWWWYENEFLKHFVEVDVVYLWLPCNWFVFTAANVISNKHSLILSCLLCWDNEVIQFGHSTILLKFNTGQDGFLLLLLGVDCILIDCLQRQLSFAFMDSAVGSFFWGALGYVISPLLPLLFVFFSAQVTNQHHCWFDA